MKNIACVLGLSVGIGFGLILGGCATSATPANAAAIELPAHAAPSPALAELAFLTGRWVSVNPNKTVNDEVWTPPRGNSMAALFRQVRRDGKPALHEVSLITAEESGVYLRVRHLHAALDVPEKQADVKMYKLVSAGGGRCEFTGTVEGGSADVASVVYRLDGPNTLIMEVTYAPGGKEKGYSLRYAKE
jgi:hypothetical protein